MRDNPTQRDNARSERFSDWRRRLSGGREPRWWVLLVAVQLGFWGRGLPELVYWANAQNEHVYRVGSLLAAAAFLPVLMGSIAAAVTGLVWSRLGGHTPTMVRVTAAHAILLPLWLIPTPILSSRIQISNLSGVAADICLSDFAAENPACATSIAPGDVVILHACVSSLSGTLLTVNQTGREWSYYDLPSMGCPDIDGSTRVIVIREPGIYEVGWYDSDLRTLRE